MIRRFLFLVDGRANGSRQDAHQDFYRKAANNAKPGFCRAGFPDDMAGIGATRIFRIAVLAAIRCSISTRSARKSAHKRSPPDSGLVQKSDGERSPISARQIEFAASLPLIGSHGLIR